MMTVIHLTRQEMRNLFVAPSTYIALVLSLTLMGFFYFLVLISAAAEPSESPPPAQFFSLFWIPVLLIVPMLTMRSFAEERRLGTIETLLSAPIYPSQIVVAKFFAAYAFYLLVWVGSLAFPWIGSMVVEQPDFTAHVFDRGTMMGGMAFVALSGTLFVAIGIFTSSLTRSQLVAGMLSFSTLFMLIIGLASLRLIQWNAASPEWLGESLLSYIHVFDHFEDFSRGIIDSRPFAYYLSGTLAVLGVSVLILESKR